MQRILTEEEYRVVTNKANKFDEIRKSVIKSIRKESHNVYAEKNGMRIIAFPSTTYIFDMNLFDICKSLDIDIPKDISICFKIR